jgi:hypothetical protein
MFAGKNRGKLKRAIPVCKLPARVSRALTGGTEMPFIDFKPGDPAPKRGDLVQSNVEHRGNGRERTWFVLRVRPMRKSNRYNVWMVRWWELDSEMRLRLFKSAERAGGQRVIEFRRYPAKRRQTFEEYVSRELSI